jgi:hypothetical protein
MPCSFISFLHPVLAHADASGQQFLPHPRPAVFAFDLGVDGLDVHQQGFVADALAPWFAGLPGALRASARSSRWR